MPQQPRAIRFGAHAAVTTARGSAPLRRPAARRDRGAQPPQQGNALFNWQEFHPVEYERKNYKDLRGDDRDLLLRTGEFFNEKMSSCRGRGVDVGSGANLYPVMSMLPFCETVTCWEPSERNCRWLTNQIESGYTDVWTQYWMVLQAFGPHAGLGSDARAALRSRGRVAQHSIFELPARAFDIGTMFFVAESITDDPAEFNRATQRFVRALKPGAPFAAAFMRMSRGYFIRDSYFPAVEIDKRDVVRCLDGIARADVRIIGVPHADIDDDADDDFDQTASVDPLRGGYDGMILALGTATGR